MSKSTGNTIGIAEPPEGQYGKVMSIPDEAMRSYFELVTRWPPARIAAIFDELAAGRPHPRDVKMALAWEIVSIFYGDDTADAAAEHFQAVFQRRELPPDMPVHPLAAAIGIVDLLTESGLAASPGEARRLVAQGGVRLDGAVIDDIAHMVEPAEAVLQVGRRRYVQLLPAGD
jgi:tyrosyl-tRNA synthetase